MKALTAAQLVKEINSSYMITINDLINRYNLNNILVLDKTLLNDKVYLIVVEIDLDEPVYVKCISGTYFNWSDFTIGYMKASLKYDDVKLLESQTIC